MKILQVNSVYPFWSTGKITHDIHTELIKEGHQSIVCYGRGEDVSSHNVYKICTEKRSRINRAWERISGVMYGGHFLSTLKLIKIIQKEKPDIVHLQCINNHFLNIYNIIQYLKKRHIKTVLTLHAEFMYTANCGHALECERWKSGCGHCPRLKQETRSLLIDSTAYSWNQMRKAFEGEDENFIVVSVSPWLMQRAKEAPILANKKHIVIYNGLDTSIFLHHSNNQLRKEYGIGKNKKIVLHVTPNFTDEFNHIKGGRFVIDLAKRMPKIKFVVAGPTYKELNIPSNILLLGSVTNPTLLADWYSTANLTLLTSKKETFSMVCAESLSCGTPVVGFQAGAPEQISIPEYSCFVAYGNIDLLQTAVERFMSQDFDKKKIANEAALIYSKENMAQNYINLYQSMLKT